MVRTEMTRTLEMLEMVYPEIKAIDNKLALMCFIGCVVDQWLVDHDLPNKEGDTILKSILAVREIVDEMAPLKKTVDF